MAFTLLKVSTSAFKIKTLCDNKAICRLDPSVA